MRQIAPYTVLSNLPVEREKVETIEILKQANKAGSALAELKGLAKTIPNQEILINALVLQEAKDSSEIENIVTTQDELYKALTATNPNISQGTKEVVNYRKALFRGFDLIKSQGFLRINDIVTIQQELVENTAGIRNTPGTVLKNDKTGEIVYTPPQNKQEIMDLLTNLVLHYNEQNDDLPPLINLAILHYQFESIHPFYDGNGRTGRILNILYLILNNLIEIPILYLSSYIIKNKADYYKLLNQTNKTGDWKDWILYILKAVEITSLQTIKKINSINALLEQTILQVQKESPKIYKKELIELLFEQPYSKIDFVVNRLNVERKAASRYLKELENIGILKSYKAGRETLYINTRLIDVLKQ
ncbi:MAG TPA: Fic family protein [Clostridiales bacterium]|nr:Fic family protein [Clostridiales bacterium]HQP69756.1 Fic family protein [Clostridiales bacterium]